MKRTILLCFLCLSLFLAVGCGESNPQETTAADTTEPTVITFPIIPLPSNP